MDFDIPIEVKYLDGRYEKFWATIRRVNTGFFRISAPVAMKPERRLAMFYNGNRMEGSVVYSTPGRHGSFNVGITCDESEVRQRHDPRLHLGVTAQLSNPRLATPIKVKINDLSRGAFGFGSPVALTPGEQVSIEWDNFVAFVEIRQCTPAKGHYQVACAVEEFIRFADEPEARVAPKLSFWASLKARFRTKKHSAGLVGSLNPLANR